MIEKIYLGLAIIIVLILFYCLYISYIFDESILKQYNIDSETSKYLSNKHVHKKLSESKSVFKKIINSSFYGILQGGATGFITGGLPGALGGAFVFGTVMPIIATYREINPLDESLIAD